MSSQVAFSQHATFADSVRRSTYTVRGHHSQHISLGVVKADACAIRGETDKCKAELVNHMGAMGARM